MSSFYYYLCEFFCVGMMIKQLFKNPFILITSVAFLLQTIMLVLFYALPDPLGLSMSEMFAGKTIWQIFMAYGAILVMSSIFTFLKSPRALAVFYVIYFFFAVADYEIFRFNHQRLSYSFIRTYFHFSNITDATTVSTLGGDGVGTVLWIGLVFLFLAGGIAFCVTYSIRQRRMTIMEKRIVKLADKRVPVTMLVSGIVLSIIPLFLFIIGARGVTNFPFQIDWRFTLGKYTLTAPVLHIAGLETFEFFRDGYSITDELVRDLDAFLPADFAGARSDKNYPGYRKAPTHEYKATRPYNIVFIFGESYKGRVLNQMLEGDTTIAPALWKMANVGGLWFKNAFSGSYPTVRGTTSAYLGFPSHPNRDVPAFYASNHFKGFQEYLTNYHRAYMTVSNPVFDHTLPFVERFYGGNWRVAGNPKIPGTSDSLGMDLAIEMLKTMPTDSAWFLAANTIATHIPFYGYPDSYASKPEDAMVRFKNALRYTDEQMGRFFEALYARPDFDRTVVFVVGDHDTPVDSIDYKVPQPLGVSAAQIFMGIFSADTNLFKGLEIREDVASQLDIGPTIFDLAQVRAPSHFWGYDLLTEKRPAEQPALFYTQNAYYLGFRDSVLTGGLESDEVYKGKNGSFEHVSDSLSLKWKAHAVGASKVLRSLLRNDNMLPH